MGKPAELVVLHRRRIRAVRFPNPCAAFSLSWTTRSAFHYRLLCYTDSGMIANMRLLKAARLVLGWSQEELADKSGISRPTISKLDAGEIDVRVHTLLAVQYALEDGGIKFLEIVRASCRARVCPYG